MQVGFAVGTAADEAATWAALERPLVADEYNVMNGRLTLSDDGAPEIVIEDDLEFLVLNLCLRMPPRLAAQGQATVRMASMARSVTLAREGDTVLLTDGDGAELGRLPYQGLMNTLHECAERFTGYVEALASKDPEWTALHAVLRSTLERSETV